MLYSPSCLEEVFSETMGSYEHSCKGEEFRLAYADVARKCARFARPRRSGDQHLNVADAGHIIRPPFTPTKVTWSEGLYSGRTPEGNAKASVEAWVNTLRFLGEHLGA